MFKAVNLSWLAALALQGIMAGVLVAKKMWRRFPLFVAYTTSNLVLGAVLYVIFLLAFQARFLRPVYANVYWLNEAIGVLLGLAVVYEIFKHLFDPYSALKRLATQVFQGAILLLIVLGCIVVYVQPLGETNHVQAALYVVEQASRILEVGLLCFLFLFASAFGLHWRQYVFGIAVGLGVFAAAELVGVTMRVQFGFVADPVLNVIRSVSFNSSLVIWISYILAPELAASPADLPKRAQLEQWNNAVMELIYQ